MSAKDISRFLFQPEKHYSGARMQQGRVILDSDFNENERLDDEDLRRTLLDFVCTKGTANDGFRVGPLQHPVDVEVPIDDTQTETVAGFDFEVGEGSYLLGGLRFEAGGGETLLAQSDGLRITTAENLPRAPSLAEVSAAERHDLVYLRAWEQCVSAVEDAEIRERALGGPDTSVRVRRMRRLEVLTLPEGVEATCGAAFAELRRQLTEPPEGAEEPHGFDDSGCELLSRARLTVTLGEDGAPEDACKPRGARGYLGADNQAVRVRLTAPDRFVWSYDNAAPLYRVRVRPAESDELVEVEFLTLPRDQESQPLAGQTVEILPWGSLLPNQEKAMAEDAGFFARVESGFDPESGVLRLDRPVPAAMLGWLGLHDEAHSERDEVPEYLYLRLWTGGGADGEPDQPFSPGAPVELAGTGLEVSFSDPGLPGEYWIVAARPHTPEVVVPWELMSAAPSAGPRQFFDSLAVLRWFVDVDEDNVSVVAVEVHDCRHRFRPLCQVANSQGCCTVTVGDGETSFGDVDSIQAAIDLLPSQGGKVCLLPGTFRERFAISGRRDVTIQGCGRRSRVVSPDGEDGFSGQGDEPDPLVFVADSRQVHLRAFAVDATGLIGVRLQDRVRDVVLEDLELVARGTLGNDGAMPMSAVDGLGGERIRVEGCRIEMQDLFSVYPAIYLGGEGLRVIGNRIVTGSPDGPAVAQALGGVQIASNSFDVEVRGNEILGGLGHGIALGSVRFESPDFEPPQLGAVDELAAFADGGTRFPMGIFVIAVADACPEFDPLFPDGFTIDDRRPVPEGNLEDVRIVANRIAGHGGSGISTVAFWPSTDPDAYYLIDVVGLVIDGNDLISNARRQLPPGSFATGFDRLAGGVALASATGATVRENRIREHGAEHSGPVVGIGFLAAAGCLVEDNHLWRNGRSLSSVQAPQVGFRAGIALGVATRIVDSLEELFEPDGGGSIFVERYREGAVRILGNTVHQVEGKALWIRQAAGPVAVEGNHLESHGDHGTVPIELFFFQYGQNQKPASGACVEVFNVGQPLDVFESSMMADPLADGRVLFQDNQTLLDWRRPGGGSAAVLLWSADDVSVEDNQMVANLHNFRNPQVITEDDLFGHPETDEEFQAFLAANTLGQRSYLLYHLVALGETVRALGNRLTEGQTDTAASILTWVEFSGFANTTAGNQTTHCIYTVPLPEQSDATSNRVRIVNFGCAYQFTYGTISPSGGVFVIIPSQTVDPSAPAPGLTEG